MTRKTPTTFAEVCADRSLRHAIEQERWNAADAQRRELEAILAANPQIGALNGGKFYVVTAPGEYRVANHPSKLV